MAETDIVPAESRGSIIISSVIIIKFIIIIKIKYNYYQINLVTAIYLFVVRVRWLKLNI